jgi:hypothetical protein
MNPRDRNQGVNPADLTQNQHMTGSGYIPQDGYGFTNSSMQYSDANARINDDELLEAGDYDDQLASFTDAQGFGNDQVPQQYGSAFLAQNQIPYGYHPGVQNVYSSTPEGNPLASPYTQNFAGEQFQHFQQQQLPQGMASPSFRPSSLRVGSADLNRGSFEENYMSSKAGAKRPSSQRKGSQGNSGPMTPKTPAIGGLNLGTPDSAALGQPILGPNIQRHQKTQSQPWSGQANSLQSFPSPLSSPGHSLGQHGIVDLMNPKQMSLPSKVEHSPLTNQEAKRRRRRESHNMVERRRRDNINERIQELCQLVPHHRLEDDKVKKHLQSATPLSPGAGISPPHATSLLAGGTGRRATGGITTGIPPDEKDKGPNKGDILNGAVGWTRDLMWCLYQKMQHEDIMREQLISLGQVPPFDPTDEEMRMRTELMEAMEKNNPDRFAYSRAHGTGLHVPRHTDLAGNSLDSRRGPINHTHQRSHSSTMSPVDSPSGMHTGQAYWSPGGFGNGDMFLKEEDEGMDES